MADAYGGISLSTSEDCVVNSAELISILNRYEWSYTNGEWIVDEREEQPTFWYHDEFNFHHPTAFPHKYSAVVLLDANGAKKRIPYDEATEDDFGDYFEIESEEMSLRDFSKDFSKSISNGWVEIACTATEKNNCYVYFESIRIYADGRAESRHVRSGTCTQPHYEFETFDPKSI